MLQFLAVIHVLLSIALVGLILMHSVRHTGFVGTGFTPASQGGTHIVERNLTRLTVLIGILFFADTIARFTSSSSDGASPPRTESAHGSAPERRRAGGAACPVDSCEPPARLALAMSQAAPRSTPSSTRSTRRLGTPSKSIRFGRPAGSSASSAIDTFSSKARSPIRPLRKLRSSSTARPLKASKAKYWSSSPSAYGSSTAR